MAVEGRGEYGGKKWWGAGCSVTLHAALLAGLLLAVAPRPPVVPLMVVSVIADPGAGASSARRDARPVEPASKHPSISPDPVATPSFAPPAFHPQREKRIVHHVVRLSPLTTASPAAETTTSEPPAPAESKGPPAPVDGSGTPTKAGTSQAQNGIGTSAGSPSRGGGAPGVTGSQIDAYMSRIRQMIQEELVYPAGARRIGIQGKCKIHFEIGADGRYKPETLRIVDSAGDSLLDEGAMKTIREIETFPPPPVAPFPAEIPVTFRLTD